MERQQLWISISTAVALVAILGLIAWLGSGDDETATDGVSTTTTVVIEESTTSAQESTSTPEDTTTTVEATTTTEPGPEATTTTEVPTTTTAAPDPEPDDGEIPAGPGRYEFTFDEDEQDWEAGFTDLPADDQESFDLEAEWSELPDELEGGGLHSVFTNRSDDTFAYWFRKLDGFVAGEDVEINAVVELATNVPPGLAGIGGSPTEALYVKVAGSSVEPESEPDDLGTLRLNVDIGSQSEAGDDSVVIGTFDNENVSTEEDPAPFVLVEKENPDESLTVTASDDGEIWVLVGVDSGFEGTTDFYIASIGLTAAQ